MLAALDLSQPLFQITLPIVISIFVATWAQNRRIDDVAKRLDDVARRVDRLERVMEDILKTLVNIEHRLTVLEDRSSPIGRR